MAAHTLPVLYERYEDIVDDFICNLLGQIQNQYKKIDSGLLSRIPKGNLEVKKFEREFYYFPEKNNCFISFDKLVKSK